MIQSQVRVHVLGHAPDGTGDSHRIRRGAHLEVHRAERFHILQAGHIDGWRHLFAKLVVLRVAHHAYDLHVAAVGFIAKPEPPTDSVSAAEKLADELLVDDANFGSSFRIPLANGPSEQQRNSHGFKEVRSDRVDVGPNSVIFLA